MTGFLDAAVFCFKAIHHHPSEHLKKTIQTFQ